MSGLCDIIVIDFKKDGSVEAEKYLVQHSSQMISKISWIAKDHFAYLAFNNIHIQGLETRQQLIFQQPQEDKIKDFCVLPSHSPDTFIILAVDFNGSIYQHKFTLKETSKTILINQIVLPEQLKGRNKTSFSIAHFPSTNILFISYKNGTSFLAQYEEKPKQIQLTNVRCMFM